MIHYGVISQRVHATVGADSDGDTQLGERAVIRGLLLDLLTTGDRTPGIPAADLHAFARPDVSASPAAG